MPGGGVHQAGDIVVASAPTPALLVAAEATANVFGCAAFGLGHQMRVGDLGTHDRHQIGPPGAQHRVGVVRRADIGLGGDQRGQVGLFQPLGQIGAEVLGILKAGQELVEIEIAARADGDIIHQPLGVVQRHDLDHFVMAEAHGLVGIVVHRQADDEIRAAGGADARHDFAREPGAVFKRAAPLVAALVGKRGPELVKQAVIGGPDLDPVEAGFLAPDRGIDKALNGLLDLILGHGVAAIVVMIAGPARGRPVGMPGIVPVAMRAHVIELLDHHRAMRLAGLGDAGEMRDDVIAGVAEIAARQHGGGMDRHRLDHDHRRATQSALQVIGQVLIPRQTVMGHVGGVGTEHDAVLQLFVAQLDRGEDMFEAHAPVSSASSPARRLSPMPAPSICKRRRWL